MVYFTNAPESYDYQYVTTVQTYPITAKGQTREWRKIEVSDVSRFEAYQKPRYSSGLYTTLKPGDTDDVRHWVKLFGLPEEALSLT